MTVGLSACAVEAPEAPADVPTSDGSTEQVIARALALELDTEYTPPPGEALHHETAGFAQILCAGVFITGLDPADAAANVGGFISDFELRGNVVDTVVDFENQMVALTLPDGVTRTSKLYKGQGCVTHAIGEDSVAFEAVTGVLGACNRLRRLHSCCLPAQLKCRSVRETSPL